MMITPRFLAIFAAIVALLSLAFYYVTGARHEPVASANVEIEGVAPSAVGSSTPPNPVSSQTSSPAAQSDSQDSMLRELAKSTNYKKLFEDSKANPTQGGLYVAGLINNRCAEIQAAARAGAELVTTRPHGEAYRIQASVDRLSSLCSGMIEDDIDRRKGYTEFLARVNRRDDPLMRLRDDFSKDFADGKYKETANATLQAMRLSSPEVFQNLTLPIFEGAYYFNGKSYPFEVEGAKTLHFGKLLAVCQIWRQCGSESDYYLLNACASSGKCETTYDALASLELTADQLSEARNIAKVMSAAATSGNMGAFFPPSK